MRQVFASQRIENVEAVAQLLRDAGIEVQIQNGRGWRGAIRGNFSYRASAEHRAKPSVWVVRSDDQTRARQLLREHGLWQSDSLPGSSFMMQTMHSGKPRAATEAVKPSGAPKKIRLGLLLLIGLVAVAIWQGVERLPKSAPAPATATTAVATPRPNAGTIPVVEARTHVIATPPALAEMLLRRELQADHARALCLMIDGADPGAEQVQALQHDFPNLKPASACANDAAAADSARLAIDHYTTDGSGVGTVQVSASKRASEPAQVQTLDVARTGTRWDVTPGN